MDEVFDYSATLADELRKEGRRRLIFWVLFLSPFWMFGFGLASFREGGIGPGCAVGALVIVSVFELFLRRFGRQTCNLMGGRLELHGQLLRQVAPTGKVIGEVDLCLPFAVGYPTATAGSAIYEVTQQGHSIRFSSRIQNAERLVKELLKQREWPPGAD